MSHACGSFVSKICGAIDISTKMAIKIAATQKRLSRLSLRQTSPHRVIDSVCGPSSMSARPSIALVERLLIRDPRVDPRAQQVNEQVREYEDDGGQRDQPHDERSVLGADAGHQGEPE